MGATSMDAIKAVNDSFYRMILVTVGVVLLFVAISFRSILLPFRAVLTIGLTLLFVYGFAGILSFPLPAPPHQVETENPIWLLFLGSSFLLPVP